MGELPRGTVTFLFTDIEGSTRLLHELGDGYAGALAEHRRLLRTAFTRRGGVEVDTQGDAFFYAFGNAADAVAAAHEGQAALGDGPVAVRMGLHTGSPQLAGEGYVGLDVHLGARIAAAGHGGQILLSGSTHMLAGVDAADLGEHRLKDFEQPVSIFQLGVGTFPPLKTISNTNLPRPASRFVGRTRERTEVVELLREARLVTLTGPGGSGKTRLAIEAAAELVPEQRAGVFWIGLAALRDQALVLETISQTLGANSGLVEHVGERELLLLLDNFEQVVESAPLVADLVEACPKLRLLVTSREVLRVRGEVEYAVQPLADPEAVELFRTRAGVEPDEFVEELCRRLDNLPLAIELAAARATVLSPPQLLERLSQRLDLLRGGRDSIPRQNTLRATIGWSYDLLDDAERRLFACLSVFAGGCTLEAAEAVCDAELDALQSLVDTSLIRRTGERFWMLETTREYALERAAESDEEEVRRRSHARYYLALAQAEEPRLPVGDADAVARLRPELPNFRAALETAVASRDAETALALVAGLRLYWDAEGLFAEGRLWAERALALGGTASWREGALATAGACALMQGATADAMRYLEELLEVCSTLSDPARLATALTLLGHVALVDGDAQRSLDLYERALTEERADGTSVSRSLNNVGFALLHLDRLDEAENVLADAVAAADAECAPFIRSSALNNLARIALTRQDAVALRRRLQESLDSAVTPSLHVVTEALELVARLCCLESRWASAARAVGGVDALREQMTLAATIEEVPGRESLTAARAAAGAQLWEREVALGRAAEDPLRLARDCLDWPR